MHFAGAGLFGPLFAQTPDTVPAREIAKIDSDYSNLSAEKGMPAASVRYFAVDGIAFASKATNGQKYWSARKNFPGILIWQPIFAAASAAGDLGYTTGPWELKNQNESGSLGYGNYVTIWSKQPNSEWKIALDVGTENPQPTEPPANLQVLPPDATAGKRSLDSARANLQKTQRRFLESARRDNAKAILDSASENIRAYREKSAPAVGLVAAQLMLSSEHAKVVYEFGGSKISSSGDLSYTYGNYSQERANLDEHGIYVMIWRADLNGDWKLILHLQKKDSS